MGGKTWKQGGYAEIFLFCFCELWIFLSRRLQSRSVPGFRCIKQGERRKEKYHYLARYVWLHDRNMSSIYMYIGVMYVRYSCKVSYHFTIQWGSWIWYEKYKVRIWCVLPQILQFNPLNASGNYTHHLLNRDNFLKQRSAVNICNGDEHWAGIFLSLKGFSSVFIGTLSLERREDGYGEGVAKETSAVFCNAKSFLSPRHLSKVSACI